MLHSNVRSEGGDQMALATITDSSLRLEFNSGLDEGSGKPLVKAKSFNNIKIDATPDQLYAVAQVLAGLQQHSLKKIERKDTSSIV
jgi:hypothetical protein